MNKSFSRRYLLVPLENLSVPTKFIIPTIFYKIGLTIYFLQVCQQILNYDNEASNYWLRLANQIIKISSGIGFTNEPLFWIIYVIYFISIHVFILVMPLIRRIESVVLISSYNTIITWYPFVLYTINLNLNHHIISNNSNSPVILIAVIGLTITLLVGQFSCYISTNYIFEDINLFKRSFSYIGMNLIIRFITELLQLFEGQYVRVITYTLLAIFAIISILDSFQNKPFTNVELLKFYSIISCVTFTAIWIVALEDFGYFNQQEVVMMIISLPLVAILSSELINQVVYRVMIDSQSILDFKLYSEMIMQMFYKDQFSLLIAIRFHINTCYNVNCYCIKYGENQGKMNSKQIFTKIYQYREVNQRVTCELKIEHVDIVKLLDSLYQQLLAKPIQQKQWLQFIYLSYMEKYSGNQLLCYFFLKKLPKQGFVLFQQLQYSVLSNRLEQAIVLSNKLKSQELNDETMLKLETIVQIEKNCQFYLEKFLQCLNYKLQIWQQLELGNDTIGDLLNILNPLLRKFLNAKQIIENQIDSILTDNQNVAYLKIKQLQALIVLNQLTQVLKLENKINDLRNRDQYREDGCLNNYNFMRGQNVIIRAGLSVSIGRILNKENDRIRKFFGYSTSEIQSIDSINDLMPRHIAILHNQILTMYLQKGQSPLLYTTRLIFLVDNNQFLFPVTITVRNDFSDLDDCVFNVNLLKTQPKELIMFNTHGQMIGLSEKLFNMISSNSQLFSYQDILSSGIIQVFMPNIVTMIDSISEQLEMGKDDASQTFENLQCSFHSSKSQLENCKYYFQHQESISSDIKKLYETSSKESDLKLSLIDSQDRKQIKQYLHQIIKKDHTTRLKIRFRFHSFYRQFRNLDIGVLQLVGQKMVKDLSLHYFVLECLEINQVQLSKKQKAFKNAIQQDISQSIYVTGSLVLDHTSQPVSVPESFHQWQDDSNVSERKQQLQLQGYDQMTFPKFQPESPRVIVESPKETARNLIPDKDPTQSILDSKSKFFQDMLSFTNRFKNAKISSVDDPKFISKNQLQEQGYPDPMSEFDQQQEISMNLNQNKQSSELNEVKRKVYKTKAKKFILDEQSSQTSNVSRTEREHLDEIYTSKKMPSKFRLYQVILFLIILSIVLIMIVSIVILKDRLQIISKQGSNIKISYQFNDNFISYTQQMIYLLHQFDQSVKVANITDIWQKSIQEATDNQIKLLNSEIQQYVGVVDEKINLSIYDEQGKSQNYILDIYSFQSDNLYQFQEQDNISVRNLVERIPINYQVDSQIIDNQLQIIQFETNNLLSQFEIITIIFSILIFISYLPILRLIIHFNGYIERIILLITRVNQEECQKEVKRLVNIMDTIQSMKGISLVSSDYVSNLIFQKIETIKSQNRSKSNLIQTKIYNIRLPSFFVSLKYLAIIIIADIYIIGGYIFANQIPYQYVQDSQNLGELIEIYQNISYNNLIYDAIALKIPQDNEQLKLFYNNNMDAYSLYMTKIEKSGQDLFYFQNLCEGNYNKICESEYRKFYAKGIGGVVSQIKTLIQEIQNPYILTSEEYYGLMVLFPQMVTPKINLDLDQQSSQLIQIINNLQNGLIVYIIIGGIIIILFGGLFLWFQQQGIFFFQKQLVLQNKIQQIKHLLILIPGDKLNEEITISMLKQIRIY